MTRSALGLSIARLGGADPAVLEESPSQASRFIQMGLVLLSTAGLAAVSMAFAVNDALRVSGWAAVLIGLGWGAVVLNLDRLLIVTLKPTNGRWAIVGILVPRIVMAALVGIVIATPLTLRVFDSEIESQIAFDQAHSAAELGALRDKDPQRAELNTLNTKISHYEDVLAGRVQCSTPLLDQARSDLKAAQNILNATQASYEKAYCKYTYEIDGVKACGESSVADPIASAKAELDRASAALNQARAVVQQKQADLDHAQDSSKAANSDTLAADQRDGNAQLPALRDQRANIEGNVTRQTLDDAGRMAGTGILSRIEALNLLANANTVLRISFLVITGLLILVQLLPVLVKALTGLEPAATSTPTEGI